MCLAAAAFAFSAAALVAQPVDSLSGEAADQQADNGVIGKYRRSSLYTVLMKHSAFKYGEAIDSAFMAMPTPDKFNCHDLAVKSFESSAVKQKKKSSMPTSRAAWSPSGSTAAPRPAFST